MTSNSTTDWCCGPDEDCYVPLNNILDVLSKKYAIAIICVLKGHDELRFGDIEKHLQSASTSTITDRLNELVAAGFLERRQYDEIPPKVEYELTQNGREVSEKLRPLLEWIDENN